MNDIVFVYSCSKSCHQLRPIIINLNWHNFMQGFGKWDGEYFHFYEGYLFRLGLIVEWYHAENVVNRLTEQNDSVSLLVETNDPLKRRLLVNFTDFQDRQFSMHAEVVGGKANDR